VKSKQAWQVFIALTIAVTTHSPLQAQGKAPSLSPSVEASSSPSTAKSEQSNSHATSTETTSSYSIGYTVLSEQYAYREQPVPFKIAVWYPSSDAKKSDDFSYPIGSNKIASEAKLDAPIAEGKFPVLFYSHGATGAGTSSFFVCELLARSGYIVVAPDYLDTVYVARIDQPVPFDGYLWMRTAQYISWLRELGLNKSSREGRILFAYRPVQLKQTIEKIIGSNKDSKSPLYQHLDEERIGLFGHSFGAWTSLLLAGASPSLHDARVKAVVALSGPVNEHVYAVGSDNDLESVKVPVLFEYGDKEPASGRQDDKKFLFEKAKAPKMLIAIKDADHLSFSGGVKGEHKLASEYLNQDLPRKTIAETTLDFFNAFLKDDAASKTKLKNRTEGIAASAVEF